MNIDISIRDKKILLMFFGVAIFGAGYLFGYKPQMDEAESYRAKSVPVQEHLGKLVEMAKKKDFYVEETASIQKKIDEYTAQFPADVKEEDGILLANSMENTLDMSFSNVGLGSREFVASMDGSTQEEAEQQQQTLSEQNNAKTQEQIDEIEGKDSTEEKEEDAAASVDSTLPVLYRTQDTLQFTGTYAGLKDIAGYLSDQNGRITVDSVNASFDSSTGNLTGTLTVNLFSMTGTSNSYTEPDAGSVAHGTGNIFGTIDASTENK